MNGNNATTKNQDSLDLEEKFKHEKCRGFVVQQNPTKFLVKQGQQFYIMIWEDINKWTEREWRCIRKRSNSIVLVKPNGCESLDIQCYDLFVSSEYQRQSSPSFAISEEASASSVRLCECFNTLSTLRNILQSASTERWVCFWICRGKTYISITDEQTSIPVGDFNQLETNFDQLIKINDDVTSMINTQIPLGETENDVKIVITSHIVSQEDFLGEVKDKIYQKRKIIKNNNTLIYKYCGTADLVSTKDVPSNSSNVAPVSAPDSQQASIPLRTLLQCIVVRLTPSNWTQLRRYVSRDVPSRILRNISDNIDLFQELENRGMIKLGNTEYIRNGFYEIGRVDLVHLLDCIQDGDYSLLNLDTVKERRIRSDASNLESSSLVDQVRGLTVDTGRNDNDTNQSSVASSSGANTQSSVTEIREIVETDGQIPRSPSNVADGGNRDRPLQRRYRNVPQRTTPSTPYPVQEEIEIPENVLNNEGDTSSGATGNTSIQSANTEGLTPQSVNSETTTLRDESTADTLPQGEIVEGTRPRGENVEDTRTWVMSREYSCSHYDRYCVAQFACCEPFWACHRCHNAKSRCGERKLRSRDIKKVKCRRCGKVQDFPKESPDCVECNLKFAEYFCPICQHLTGQQNRPFHCEKCGICRVHGDRSFHCDTCGVCLDVNLRENHRCREGSAHDNCCICGEDAFTGCQILPCSHKVHKECVSQLVENGTMKCPICGESFAHKMGKSKQT